MRRWLALLTITIAGVLGLFLLDHVYRTQIERDNTQELALVGERTASDLGHTFQLNIEAVESLRAFMLATPTLPDFTSFDNFVAHLFPKYPPIRTMQYVDTDRIIRHTYPLEGNEEVIGLDISTRPTAAFVEKAIEERRLVVTNPVLIVQGTLAVVARAPLYRHDEFHGLVAGVFDVEPIVNDAFSNLPPEYETQLSDSTDHVFWGPESIDGETYRSTFPIGDTTWTLLVGWHTAAPTPSRFVLGLIWIGGGALLVSVLFLVNQNWRKFQQIIERSSETRAKLAQREAQYETAIHERNQFQTALQDREERLRQTVTAAKVGLWDWDMLTNDVYFSPEWKRQIGYEDHEIPNDFSEWQNRVHPDDLERALKTIQDYVAAPYPNYQNEFRFRHKDGSYRWILAQADLLYDEQGKPFRMLGSHIDITEHKKIEEALRESEQRFSSIFHSSPIATVLTRTSDSKLVDANAQLTVLTGYSRDELIGKTSEELNLFADPQMRSRVRDMSNEVGDLRNIEVQLRTKSGEMRYISLSTVIIELDGERHIISMANDITERKQTDEALRESAERLNAAQESARVGSWELDVGSNEGTWSRQMFRLFDIDPADGVPSFEEYMDYIHPDDRHLMLNVLKDMENGEEPVIQEFRSNPERGSLRYFIPTWDLQRDQADNPIRFSGTVQDITERKLAEEHIRYQSSLIENVSDAIISTNLDFVIQSWNKAAEHIYGWQAHEVIGKQVHDVLKTQYPNEDAGEGLELSRVNGSWVGEVVQQRKDDTLVAIQSSVSTIYDSAGSPIGMVAANRDISARQRAENALRESEARLSAITRALPDLAFIVDGDGTYIEILSKHDDLLYTGSAQSMIGRHIHEVLPQAEADQIMAAIHKTIETGSSQRFEYQLDVPVGRVWFETRTALIEDQISDSPLVVMLPRDITERERLRDEQTEREKLEIELQAEKELNEFRTQFMSMVSHDFRTPLTIIQTSANMMQEYKDQLSPENFDKRLDHVNAQAQRLTDMLDAVMLVIQGQAGHLECNPVATDLLAFCEQILDGMRGIATDDLHLSLDAEDGIGIALVDQELLRHILSNLISNAIKYSPNGGDVTLAVRRESARVAFQIIDQGIGIPQDDLSRLFEPYNRASNTGKISGSGLGLSIVKLCTEAHNGSIEVVSQPGEGATFTVTLPAG